MNEHLKKHWWKYLAALVVMGMVVRTPVGRVIVFILMPGTGPDDFIWVLLLIGLAIFGYRAGVIPAADWWVANFSLSARDTVLSLLDKGTTISEELHSFFSWYQGLDTIFESKIIGRQDAPALRQDFATLSQQAESVRRRYHRLNKWFGGNERWSSYRAGKLQVVIDRFGTLASEARQIRLAYEGLVSRIQTSTQVVSH